MLFYFVFPSYFPLTLLNVWKGSHEKLFSLFVAFVLVCLCVICACVTHVHVCGMHMHACVCTCTFVSVRASYTCGRDNVGLVFAFNVVIDGVSDVVCCCVYSACWPANFSRISCLCLTSDFWGTTIADAASQGQLLNGFWGIYLRYSWGKCFSQRAFFTALLTVLCLQSFTFSLLFSFLFSCRTSTWYLNCQDRLYHCK